MTVDTQKLRELHAKSTQGEWRKVDGFPYLYAFAPGQETARSWEVPCVGRFDYGEGNLEFVAAAHNEMPALLAENEALRAELQAHRSFLSALKAELGLVLTDDDTELSPGALRTLLWADREMTNALALPPVPPQGDGAC